MKLSYKIAIKNPENHMLQVVINGRKGPEENEISFFLPSWSPGSYLMREYGKNIRTFKAEVANGEVLYHEQVDKGVYRLDWKKSQLNTPSDEFQITYEIYCHELTVRTSHIDRSHAFIHGPSVFMGVVGQEIEEPTLEIEFPPLWSKVTTGLKDISTKREVFLYQAKNYDELIDTPVEIGCHETDGFRVEGVDHELAFYGGTFPHKWDLKEDIKKIVEHVSKTMRDIPYEKYTFITHYGPGLFGGLEHLNSTALQYCSRSMTERKKYVGFLELVAHEYFHTWNVKRIRPIELGPFDYLNEAKTRMHWLTEGLTSFMDQLFMYRLDFVTLEEYLELMKKNLNRYYSIPGRKFHSLEDSSFNSWIKLYRPDENSNNSSISYYLKGGLVFFVLNIMMNEKGKSITDLLDALWEGFKKRPEQGYVKEEVLKMITDIAGKDVCDYFDTMISTTNEIDFEAFFNKAGIEVEWESAPKVWLGLTPKFLTDRVVISQVALDGPAYKGGLNAGDEILAINGLRTLKDSFNDYESYMSATDSYTFTISRLGYIQDVVVSPSAGPKMIKAFKVVDNNKASQWLKARMPQ